MNLDLTEEQKLIQDTARDFAVAELEPVAASLDQGGDDAIFYENLNKLAELGFMGLNVSDEYSGSEAGVVAFSLAMTEIARGCASTAVTVSVNNMVCEVIQALGTEEQKKKYITPICTGEYGAGAFGLTEAGAGSDPSSMTTTAVKDGDEWVLNGSKIFITSGSFAGVFVVWAVTDQSAPKGKGISLFLVEAGSPGFV
ncbi:MAG: acyl-CoA dehydrogenase family protein, partial [Desulforhopalus sp.]